MLFDRIILLAGKWDTTPIVYNFLKEHFNLLKTIIEEPVPKKTFLQKRIKKFGWIRVSGQILFQLLIAKPLKKRSGKRIAEIIEKYHLSSSPIPSNEIINVSSVNSEACLQQLQQVRPNLVIVHGTRIISKKILTAVDAPFVNIHAGITPRYRGSHGAYWALANDDIKNCGVTVHFVDAGIDTGNILEQGTIPLTSKDNFATYPYLQLAEGLILLKKIVEGKKSEERIMIQNNGDSALWYHPTLWSYLWKRISRGIK